MHFLREIREEVVHTKIVVAVFADTKNAFIFKLRKEEERKKERKKERKEREGMGW